MPDEFSHFKDQLAEGVDVLRGEKSGDLFGEGERSIEQKGGHRDTEMWICGSLLAG